LGGFPDLKQLLNPLAQQERQGLPQATAKGAKDTKEENYFLTEVIRANS
jgi:hypothetical protein